MCPEIRPLRGYAKSPSKSTMSLTARLAPNGSPSTPRIRPADERPMVEALAPSVRLTLGARDRRGPSTVGWPRVRVRALRRRRPRVLLNAHVDTVPANTGYTTSPHTLAHGTRTAASTGSVPPIPRGPSPRSSRRSRWRASAAGTRGDKAFGVLFSGDEERRNLHASVPGGAGSVVAAWSARSSASPRGAPSGGATAESAPRRPRRDLALEGTRRASITFRIRLRSSPARPWRSTTWGDATVTVARPASRGSA
jgi:hypothetical protein